MSLYKQAGSEVWWVNIRHAGQRVRRSTGETDRRAAEAREREILIELWTLVPNTTKGTWGQAVAKWTTAEPRSDSELLSLAKFGRGFNDRELGAITPEAIDAALSFCKTAGTYTRYRTMIAAILNLSGVKLKLIARKDKKTKPREWLTPEQWSRLYAELPKHLKPAALFSVETGLRQANVLGLRWDHVDLDRAVAWVDAQDTKADVALTVPLSSGAVDVLKTLQGQHDVFVFTYRGRPIKEIKTAFIAACLRAGVGHAPVDGRDLRRYVGFTWHGLRHTWATWHAQNGTPLDVLQKLGGWSDQRMVANYSHHSPTHLASFANNIRKTK